MSFEKALKHMLEFEGGYANDPADSGGETFKGISRRNWPQWAGWELIDKAKADGFRTAKKINAAFADNSGMRDLVAEFYRANFWEPWERHGLPGRLTEKLFDTAVNMGVSRAAKLLQTAINNMDPTIKLAVDGVIGPQTKGTVAAICLAAREAPLLAAYAKAQANHYRAIVKAKPSQAKFLKGWLRRAEWLPD